MSKSVWRVAVDKSTAVIPILLGVGIFTFILVRVLPGDPAVFYSTGPMATPEEVEQVRRSLGLDQPMLVQLGRYLWDLGHLRFGQSLGTGRPVVVDLAERFPASLELTLVAIVLALALAIPLGVLSAVKMGSWLDHLIRLVGTIGVSMPAFVTGIVLVLVFYFHLGWAPPPLERIDPFLALPQRVTGFLLVDSLLQGQWAAFRSAASHIVLPALTMMAFALAPIMRITRASMLAVLSSDYIRTARAAGMGWRKVYVTYALRNALVPVLTAIGLILSYLIGANVVVEKVFAWPGVGSYAVNALLAADYAPVQGYVLLMAATLLAVNTLVDVLHAAVDSRFKGDDE